MDEDKYSRCHNAFLFLNNHQLQESREGEKKKYQVDDPDSLEQYLLLHALGDMQSMREKYEDGIKMIDASGVNITQSMSDKILTYLLEGLKQHMFVLKYLNLASEKSVRMAVKYLKWLEQDDVSWRSNFDEVLRKVEYALSSETHHLFADLYVQDFEKLLDKLGNATLPSLDSKPSIESGYDANRLTQGQLPPSFKLENMPEGDDDSIDIKLEVGTPFFDEDFVKDEGLEDNLRYVNGIEDDPDWNGPKTLTKNGGKRGRPRGSRVKDEARVYNCDVCSEQFISGVKFRLHKAKHMTETDGNDLDMRQDLNHEDLTDRLDRNSGSEEDGDPNHASMGSLGQSMTEASVDNQHQCPICNKQFLSEVLLQSHVNTHTDLEKPFKCDICSKNFTSQDQLRQHEDNHSTAKFACNVCEEEHTTRASLNSHRQLCHPKAKTKAAGRTKRNAANSATAPDTDKQFKCNFCGKCFINNVRLEGHVNMHTGEKPYSCELCSMFFRSKDRLRKHMQIHSGRQFACDLCDKVYNTGDSLQSHKRQVHKREKLVNDSATTALPRAPTAASSSMRAPATHKCDYCAKSFSRANTLADHINIHTGKKPYTCSECPLTFPTRFTLYRHKEKHSSATSFACDYCDKTFAIKDTLFSHTRRVHFGGAKAGYEKRANSRRADSQPSSRPDQLAEVNERLMSEDALMDVENENLYDLGEEETGIKKENIHSSDTVFSSFAAEAEESSLKKEYGDRLEDGTRRSVIVDQSSVVSATNAVSIPYVGTSPSRSSNNSSSSSSRIILRCKLCPKTFGLKAELDSHVNGHYNFSCNVCGQLFPSENAASGHMTSSHPEQARDVSFFSLQQTVNESSSAAMAVRVFVCNMCEGRYKTQVFLEHHSCQPGANHPPPPPSVSVKRSRRTAGGRRKDNQLKAEENADGDGKQQPPAAKEKQLRKRVICTYCGVPVPSNCIRYHINRHTGERPFKCKFCPKTFTSAINLAVHKDVHTSTTFLCPLCGKFYKTRESLRKHKKRVHRKKMAVKEEEKID